MKLKGIEIEPGMVIETIKDVYVAFPTKITSEPIAFCAIVNGGWKAVIDEKSIKRIRDLTTNASLHSGEILWDKKTQLKELSMKEIAEKFGVSVEQLRIKKE